MSRLFRSPAPTGNNTPPEPAPPPPTIDQAVVAREERDRQLRRRGRAANILTGPAGAGTPASTVAALYGE